MSESFIVSGKLVDVVSRRIFNAEVKIEKGKIIEIQESNKEYDNYILPGLIDAHVHIESSMLIPTGFARAAVKNGTVEIQGEPRNQEQGGLASFALHNYSREFITDSSINREESE